MKKFLVVYASILLLVVSVGVSTVVYHTLKLNYAHSPNHFIRETNREGLVYREEMVTNGLRHGLYVYGDPRRILTRAWYYYGAHIGSKIDYFGNGNVQRIETFNQPYLTTDSWHGVHYAAEIRDICEYDPGGNLCSARTTSHGVSVGYLDVAPSNPPNVTVAMTGFETNFIVNYREDVLSKFAFDGLQPAQFPVFRVKQSWGPFGTKFAEYWFAESQLSLATSSERVGEVYRWRPDEFGKYLDDGDTPAFLRGEPLDIPRYNDGHLVFDTRLSLTNGMVRLIRLSSPSRPAIPTIQEGIPIPVQTSPPHGHSTAYQKGTNTQMDDPTMIKAVAPFLLTGIIVTILLLAFPPCLAYVMSSRKKSTRRKASAVVLSLLGCGSLFFCFLLELADRLFRVFEIGMVIGVGEIALSNWVRYYLDSQKPILWVLALCFAYFICFSVSLWFWIAECPSCHSDQ